MGSLDAKTILPLPIFASKAVTSVSDDLIRSFALLRRNQNILKI
ncbi:MAG TPA: hypothetical protein VLA74_11745 [Nitrososphaeraceae archaeon]|nr:hypothetical protein [Nitrososphaeraceae archaeon]